MSRSRWSGSCAKPPGHSDAHEDRNGWTWLNADHPTPASATTPPPQGTITLDEFEAQVEADEFLLEELRGLLNRNNREARSGTPDHVLAAVMMQALLGFEDAVGNRDRWYGFTPTVGGTIPAVPHRMLP
jgi:hypothetical protein